MRDGWALGEAVQGCAVAWVGGECVRLGDVELMGPDNVYVERKRRIERPRVIEREHRVYHAPVVSLALRNLLFSVVVPGSAAVLIPWWMLTRGGATPAPVVCPAVAVIVVGAVLYLVCVWLFAVVGRGTPGPWDAPRRFVAVGPYRWVRNPIYIAALLVVLGEAWLFLSLGLLLYAGAIAIFSHVFVMGYEEPTLRRKFGETYAQYFRTVPRWIPRPPRAAD